jgi:2-methylisocitrate lyase-like PEP mutase family enzyme
MNPTTTAETFRNLHAGPQILVLPNAWDAASAALMADAGASAVATSSAAVAWAQGYPDGDALPVPTLLTVVAKIARVISVPLTCDLEGGYSDTPKVVGETAAAVIGQGAVGINIEDADKPPELLARKVEAVRRAVARTGVPLYVNARIDIYLRGGSGEAALAETLSRAELYREAGADGIFVPGPADEAVIATLAREIALPLNVMSRAGVPAAARLQALGVRRLSSATGLFRAAFGPLAAAVKAYLDAGDPSALAAAGKGMPDFNARFG